MLPPFTDLRTVQTLIEGDRLALAYGAQDVSPFDDGAYTGDVSATMLAKLGCRYVLVGHSERRQYYGEDDKLVNAKAKKAVEHGLTPIVCVGEGIEVREERDQVAFTIAHVEEALGGLTLEQIGSLVVAYEPVWAIGTGRVATPEDAQEVCGAIREWVGQWYDDGDRPGPPHPLRRVGQGRQRPLDHGPARRGRLPGRRSQPGDRGILCYSTVLRPARALFSVTDSEICELGYVRVSARRG